jgi:CO dehydrogenase maturation factor
MRVAFVGKGGSGKSVLCGTLARILARRGQRVLALDVDTVPGLAFSLGLPTEVEALLPEELGERQDGRGWVVREGVEADDLIERYAVPAPDGVRFLQLGKLPDRVRPGSTTAFRHALEEFRASGWSLVGDLAGGTRQPFFGWSDFAQVIVLVVEPSAKGVLSGRRLARLAGAVEGGTVGVVVNKLGEVGDPELIARRVGLPLLQTVPYDEQLVAVDRLGGALIDEAPDCPAVAAVESLATRLEDLVARGEKR